MHILEVMIFVDVDGTLSDFTGILILWFYLTLFRARSYDPVCIASTAYDPKTGSCLLHRKGQYIIQEIIK